MESSNCRPGDDSALWQRLKEQEEEKVAAGRYTLEEAARAFEEASGERKEPMLKKLCEAALKGTLPTYAPGSKQRYQYQPHSESDVRDFYEEVYWSDLNDWFRKNEPRVRIVFPAPQESEAVSTPDNDGPEPATFFEMRAKGRKSGIRVAYDNSGFVLIGKIPDLIAASIWGEFGHSAANDVRRIECEKEHQRNLQRQADAGLLHPLSPISFTAHTFPHGDALMRAVLSFDEFESYAKQHGVAIILPPEEHLGPDPSPEAVTPVKPAHQYRQRQQEDTILARIKAMGLDPLRLAKSQPGTSGIKAEIKKALLVEERKLFSSEVVFNKAWERLSEAKAIQYLPAP